MGERENGKVPPPLRMRGEQGGENAYNLTSDEKIKVSVARLREMLNI